MVDYGFLMRRMDGSVYFLNYGRVAEVLGDPAVEIDAGAINDEILRHRQLRKQSRLRGTWVQSRTDRFGLTLTQSFKNPGDGSAP